MTADWFRQTEWSDKHLAEFLARNGRRRGNASKAQYIRVQAVTLLQTAKPVLVAAALQLLVEHYFPKFSRELDASAASCCAGQCCEVLGQLDDAIAYYKRAVDREVEMPNATSSAAYLLAKLGVELGREALVRRALSCAEVARPSPFPWHSYILSGARAFLAALDGDPVAARAYARAALESASVSSNGLGAGRDPIGTVQEQRTRFHAAVAKIAGA
jgi:tetratricopeptide (TPR) repeat protein